MRQFSADNLGAADEMPIHAEGSFIRFDTWPTGGKLKIPELGVEFEPVAGMVYTTPPGKIFRRAIMRNDGAVAGTFRVTIGLGKVELTTISGSIEVVEKAGSGLITHVTAANAVATIVSNANRRALMLINQSLTDLWVSTTAPQTRATALKLEIGASVSLPITAAVYVFNTVDDIVFGNVDVIKVEVA